MYLFYLYVLILPFIIWGNSFEGPKIMWFLVGGFFLTLFWLHRILVRKQKFIFKKVDYYFLAWLLVLLISSLFGIHPWESIIGGSYRHQGVLFFITLWLIYKTVEIFNSKQKAFLSKGLGAIVLLESVYVLWQFASGHLYFGKPLGTLGEANAVAGMLAIGFPFVYENFSIVFFAIPVISILFAESRSGLMALLPNIILITKNMGRLLRNALIALTISLSLIFVVIVSTEKGSSPFENRPLIWKLGFTQTLSKPILGFGAESGQVVYDKAYYNFELPLNGIIIDRSHNLFLDIAMWSGVAGLVLFSLFLVERFKNIKEYSHKIAFVSFLIYSMFQPLSIVHWLLAFLL